MFSVVIAIFKTDILQLVIKTIFVPLRCNQDLTLTDCRLDFGRILKRFVMPFTIYCEKQ